MSFFAPIIIRILGSILRHVLVKHYSHAYRICCTERLFNGQVLSNKERSEKVTASQLLNIENFVMSSETAENVITYISL